MRIYTKTGDNGYTGLIGGQRIPKNDARIICYGSVDELNSYVGLCISILLQRQNSAFFFQDLIELLTSLQNDLFVMGSDLADPDLKKPFSIRVKKEMIDNLENKIDMYESELDPITFFILPGGSVESAHLQIARSITRRAETKVSKLLFTSAETVNNLILVYLNRFSDLLFVIARLINKRLGVSDVAWKS